METFDVVLVGSGFASTFFAHRYLAHRPSAKLLILERGPRKSHAEQLADEDPLFESPDTFTNRTPEKRWLFKHLVGGSSNCWTGNTPRMMPADFELKSRYGVGKDWPLSYDDIESYYCDAEVLLGVAGSRRSTPYPMSRPFPLPPHRMADPDLALAKAYPGQFFPMPCARPTAPIDDRPACCQSIRCARCPVDSKYTILNGMKDLLSRKNVVVRPGALVVALEMKGERVDQVVYRDPDEKLQKVRGKHVVLGANAIFNPHLLLRSGLDQGRPGRGLTEQVGLNALVKFKGMKGFGGSTQVTGMGIPWWDGDHRRKHAGALIECNNEPILRDLRGRYREQTLFHFAVEDLPLDDNLVSLDPNNPDRPVVEHHGISDYAKRGLDAVRAKLPELLSPLPVESIDFEPVDTEAHIQCTTPMGKSKNDSVVDSDCVHHVARNLSVLGSSTFPTASPANPTLTLCALSLRSADRLLFQEES